MFTRTYAIVLFFLTFGLISSATPAKRAQTPTDVLTGLQTQSAPILTQLSALASGGTASDATVTPLIQQLTAAVNSATTSLSGLPVSSVSRRQTQADVAALTANVITQISDGLIPLHGIPTIVSLDILLVEVDVALHELLVDLDIILVGITVLVSKLLVDVAVILNTLTFTLVLGLLGL